MENTHKQIGKAWGGESEREGGARLEGRIFPQHLFFYNPFLNLIETYIINKFYKNIYKKSKHK